MKGNRITTRLMSTTDSSEWEHIGGFKLDFVTDHPQGLLRVGDRWFLSTVRIPKGDPGAPDLSVAGSGYLIEVGREDRIGVEIDRLELSDGMVYHPGGLATDGKFLFVPVSEYRPDSSCRIYRIDLETFKVTGPPFEFPDHIGALSMDPERRRFYGMSWASKRIYIWDDQWNLLYANKNPIENVGYQDIDFLGGNTLACAGVAHFELGGNEVQIGGIDLIDANTWLPYHRIMVTTKTRTGRLLTFNAFSHRSEYPDLHLLFVPDDDEETNVEIYKV